MATSTTTSATGRSPAALPHTSFQAASSSKRSIKTSIEPPHASPTSVSGESVGQGRFGADEELLGWTEQISRLIVEPPDG